MSQRYDEIFLSKLNPKALIFISCPNKLIDVENRVILSHDNKGGLNTCLSISQVETPYERSTFIFSEMIGGLCMFVLVLSLFLVRKMNLSTDYNPREILKQMRIKNGTKIIISHLNINSIRNKFDCLTYLIDKNVSNFLFLFCLLFSFLFGNIYLQDKMRAIIFTILVLVHTSFSRIYR